MNESEHRALVRDLIARATSAGRQWRPHLEVASLRSLTGGSSSLTFIADVTSSEGDDQVVLKVAPPGLDPVRNRDVLRQARVMTALQDRSGVNVPAVRFADAGTPPSVPPFVAMEVVPGECVEPVLEPDHPRDGSGRAQTHARFLDATRMLGYLHRVTPTEAGLSDEPVVTLDAEIDRWTRAFETVPVDLQGDFRGCAGALHATIPPAAAPVINHGDFRLGNTLCAGDSVTAIIDWEIWSVGDPRIDLTWLAYFTDEAKHPATALPNPCGTPAIDEVVREYEAAVGDSVKDIEWFHALTRYKEAAATALLIKRARKTGSMNRSFQLMEPALPNLLSEARSLVGA